MSRTFSKVGVVTREILVASVLTIRIDTIVSIGGDKCNQRHLVFRESASLVRTNDGHTTQGLNSGEDANDSIFLAMFVTDQE